MHVGVARVQDSYKFVDENVVCHSRGGSVNYTTHTHITFVVFCFSAQAQEMKKVSRIGFLTLIAKPDPLESVFLQGLRDLGYVEGTKH